MYKLHVAIRDACIVYDKLPDATASTVRGNGVRFFYMHAANVICICPRLPNGMTCAAYVDIEDVCLTVINTDDARPVHVRAKAQLSSVNGGISVAYTLEADVEITPKEICVHVHVCGVLLASARVRVAFDGRKNCRLHAQHNLPPLSSQMAIHPAGTHLAIYTDCFINVFTLPNLQFARKLDVGGKSTGQNFPVLDDCNYNNSGSFFALYPNPNNPLGLCFTDAGALLTTDPNNDHCVQHWTLDGKCTASYAVEQGPLCITSHGDMVAVGFANKNGVCVFSLESGAVISKWLDGSSVYAATFVDATTLAIAKKSTYKTETVSLYTHMGALKRQMATNTESFGLAVCADGCLLVSDHRQRRIRVFSLDGSELVTSFSVQSPCEIAVSAEYAYVFEDLCGGLSRIRVFK